MKIIKHTINSTQKEISQYRIFFYLSAMISILTTTVYICTPNVFYRFTGDVNPLIVLLASIFLGYFLLLYLIPITPFKIYKKNKPITYLIIAGISLIFSFEIIVADVLIVDYPRDLNVMFPLSLLFYPAIGFIVEIIFHLLPISAIIFLLTSLTQLSINNIARISIFIVSIIEPLYQIKFTNQSSLIAVIYTSLHIFLFSITQLMIFKRFDFISMYFFRIVFYAIWHIGWGYLRIKILF